MHGQQNIKKKRILKLPWYDSQLLASENVAKFLLLYMLYSFELCVEEQREGWTRKELVRSSFKVLSALSQGRSEIFISITEVYHMKW